MAPVELSAHYNSGLVALSVAIAMVSSFVALTAVPRLHDDVAGSRHASLWTLLFGISLGAGIWSMHFIGMMAFSLPVPVRYDVWQTMLSLLVGIAFVTFAALPLRRGGELRGVRLAGVATLTGLGIAAMHYSGMAAMRMNASVSYDTVMVAVSMLIAIVASGAALWIADRLKHLRVFDELAAKLSAAVVMGLAIAAMHYSGMAAAHFYAQPGLTGSVTGLDTHLLSVALTIIATLVQGGVLVLAALDESNAAIANELELQTRLSAVMEAIPDAVFSIDKFGMIRHANTAAATLFGYSRQELLQMSVHALTPEDVRADHHQWFDDEVAGRRHDIIGYIREVRGRRKDGTLFPCELSASTFMEGVERRLSVVVRDISARKQAVVEIERLRIAVEQTPEGIFITDNDGRIVYANSAAAEMVGMEEDQLIGEYAASIRGGDKGDTTYRAIMASLQQGRPWHGDIAFTLPNGGQRLVERRIAPVFEDGEVRYHVCVDTDVTEQRQAQEKMEHTQRLESLGVLAGGIAHDFNNILTAIMGNAALGRRKVHDADAVEERLLRIEQSSQQAAELCKQMLAYSGKGKFVIRAINLSDMVEEITKLMEVSIGKNVVLRFHLDADLPAVEVDVAQLKQVVMNLVINASDAIGERSGVISLSTGTMQADAHYLNGAYVADDIEPGPFVFLEVADNGCGMDEQTQQKMFDPFFTTKFTGRGLGMSAVLGIVRGHHGAIKVYSEPGEGTTFKVLLPASDAPVGDAMDREGDRHWRGEGVVLVVDDEATIRETASLMLADMGFDTLTAEDGAMAVDVYREHQCEIVAVLLDMTMPKLDGKGCFRELRRINPDVRVILTSGYNEQDATNRFAGQGLAGFIQKPYMPEALREQMMAALSGDGGR